MDRTKRRIALGVCGALFGFAGALALSIAATLALAQWVGMVYATLIVGSAYTLLAFVCAYVFLRPSKTTEEEVDSIESVTADALADLPFDTIEAIIRKRPIATIGLALAAGYVGMRDPDSTVRHAQNMLFRLL